MSNSDISYEERNFASVLVIDRPHVHNAIARSTLHALLENLRRADAARTAAIVITGAGERAFSAGGDIEELAGLTPLEGRGYLQRFREVIDAIRHARKPVIARVDGFCLGGGNEIALACDLVVASARSIFGQAGLAIGAVPILAATQLLPRTVGEKKAREAVLLGEQYPAEAALAMGWINRVVPAADLNAQVEAWCAKIARLSPQALRIAKVSLNAGSALQQGAIDHGIELLAQAFGTEELQEGVRAFLEKRAPDFDRFR